MIVELDEMKKYLRLELIDNEEDELIESLILSAEEYLKNATGFRFTNNVPALAKLIIKMLVTHWYDNRDIVADVYMHKIEYSVNVLINQLKYSHIEEELI